MGSVVAVLASHPWWMAGLARVFMAREGVHVERWHVEGFREYRLEGISIEIPEGTGKIERLEVLQPVFWLMAVRGGVTEYPVARVDGLDWRVTEAGRVEDPPPADPFPGASTIYALLERWQPLLEQWVPHLRLRDGRVTSGDLLVEVPAMDWRDGHLALQLSWPAGELSGELEGGLIGPWKLSFRSGHFPAEFELRIVPIQTADRLRLDWQVEGLPLLASGGVDFVGLEAFPEAASGQLRVRGLNGRDFGLPQLEELSGSMALTWADARWRIVADLDGHWLEEDLRFPVRLSVESEGDFRQASVRTLELFAPWGTARLRESTSWEFPGRRFLDPFRFTLDIDLRRFGVEGLAGELHFLAESEPWQGEEELPEIKFSAVATDLGYGDRELASLDAEGSFSWPIVQISRLEAAMVEGLRIAGRSKLDLAAQSLEGSVSLAIDEWEAEGSVMVWHRDSQWNGNVAEFRLAHDGETVFSQDSDTALNLLYWEEDGWSIRNLNGSGRGDLTLEAEASGMGSMQRDLTLKVKNADSRDWAGLIPEDWPEFRIDELAISLANRTGVPFSAVEWSAQGWLALDILSDQEGIRIETHGRTGESGTHLDLVRVTGRTEPFLVAAGYFPLQLVILENDIRMNPLDETPFDFGLQILSRPTLSRLLEGYLQLAAEDPSLKLELGGTWDRPKGELRLQMESLERPGFVWQGVDQMDLNTEFAPPIRVSSPHMRVLARPDGIHLADLSFSYMDQLFEANGFLPLGEAGWRRLWEDRVLPDPGRAEGRLLTRRFSVEALAAILPEFIGRTGEIRADIRLQPGVQLSGMLELENASTRPLPMGTGLQRVSGRVEFDGRRFEIQNFEAMMERHQIELGGWMEWNGVNFEDVSMDLKLAGENLPIVRQADLIIRGDLDLSLVKKVNQPAQLSGLLSVRDSLILRDLRSFLRPGTATAAARPPFFSVESEPFENWTLRVQIRGDRMLRINSPFFHGRISSELQLLGTLRDPYLLGELSIATGMLQFPFGSMRVEDGRVEFLRADPFDPRLSIRGDSETLGYAIHLDISGSAYDPVMRFHANPPLTQDQAILLLTAGILPGDRDTAAVGQRIALFFGRGVAGDLFGGTGESWTRNLNIQSGGKLSETGRETYRIEYRVREDLSIFGENDVFDEYNFGLRWRFYSR